MSFLALKPLISAWGGGKGVDAFYFHKNASGASSRVDLDYMADGQPQVIDCIMDTLDNICAEEKIERVSLIKCDVEGGELFAFQGAIETIRRFRPFVLSEMLRKWTAKFNYHPDDIIRFFADLDYKCVALIDGQTRAGYILEHMLDTTEETNFLFVPIEKESAVRSFMTIQYGDNSIVDQ